MKVSAIKKVVDSCVLELIHDFLAWQVYYTIYHTVYYIIYSTVYSISYYSTYCTLQYQPRHQTPNTGGGAQGGVVPQVLDREPHESACWLCHSIYRTMYCAYV